MASLFQQNQQSQQGNQQGQQGNPLIAQIRQNPRAFVGQLKQDPAGFLRQCGYSIPDGMNNPGEIARYLFGLPPQAQGRR